MSSIAYEPVAGGRNAARERVLQLLSWTGQQLARHATWLTLVGAFGLVFLLYGDALGFAFFFDDTFDLTRVEGRSYWSILRGFPDYAYYRPLPFLIWKLLYGLQGHYDQATLHALVLLVHALSGWLLYLLLRQLGGGHWAIIPGVLFLTNPFAYQVVPIVGTVFHPLAGMAIMASLTLYLKGRLDEGERRWRWHVAAIGVSTIALWSHESGVAVAPFIVALEGMLLWRARQRRPSIWVIPHLAAAALFILVWLTANKASSNEQTNLAELRPKLLFFLQGFTYPASAQINWLSD